MEPELCLWSGGKKKVPRGLGSLQCPFLALSVLQFVYSALLLAAWVMEVFSWVVIAYELECRGFFVLPFWLPSQLLSWPGLDDFLGSFDSVSLY